MAATCVWPYFGEDCDLRLLETAPILYASISFVAALPALAALVLGSLLLADILSFACLRLPTRGAVWGTQVTEYTKRSVAALAMATARIIGSTDMDVHSSVPWFGINMWARQIANTILCYLCHRVLMGVLDLESADRELQGYAVPRSESSTTGDSVRDQSDGNMSLSASTQALPFSRRRRDGTQPLYTNVQLARISRSGIFVFFGTHSVYLFGELYERVVPDADFARITQLASAGTMLCLPMIGFSVAYALTSPIVPRSSRRLWPAAAGVGTMGMLGAVYYASSERAAVRFSATAVEGEQEAFDYFTSLAVVVFFVNMAPLFIVVNLRGYRTLAIPHGTESAPRSVRLATGMCAIAPVSLTCIRYLGSSTELAFFGPVAVATGSAYAYLITLLAKRGHPRKLARARLAGLQGRFKTSLLVLAFLFPLMDAWTISGVGAPAAAGDPQPLPPLAWVLERLGIPPFLLLAPVTPRARLMVYVALISAMLTHALFGCALPFVWFPRRVVRVWKALAMAFALASAFLIQAVMLLLGCDAETGSVLLDEKIQCWNQDHMLHIALATTAAAVTWFTAAITYARIVPDYYERPFFAVCMVSARCVVAYLEATASGLDLWAPRQALAFCVGLATVGATAFFAPSIGKASVNTVRISALSLACAYRLLKLSAPSACTAQQWATEAADCNAGGAVLWLLALCLAILTPAMFLLSRRQPKEKRALERLRTSVDSLVSAAENDDNLAAQVTQLQTELARAAASRSNKRRLLFRKAGWVRVHPFESARSITTSVANSARDIPGRRNSNKREPTPSAAPAAPAAPVAPAFSSAAVVADGPASSSRVADASPVDADSVALATLLRLNLGERSRTSVKKGIAIACLVEAALCHPASESALGASLQVLLHWSLPPRRATEAADEGPESELASPSNQRAKFQKAPQLAQAWPAEADDAASHVSQTSNRARPAAVSQHTPSLLPVPKGGSFKVSASTRIAQLASSGTTNALKKVRSIRPGVLSGSHAAPVVRETPRELRIKALQVLALAAKSPALRHVLRQRRGIRCAYRSLAANTDEETHAAAAAILERLRISERVIGLCCFPPSAAYRLVIGNVPLLLLNLSWGAQPAGLQIDYIVVGDWMPAESHTQSPKSSNKVTRRSAGAESAKPLTIPADEPVGRSHEPFNRSHGGSMAADESAGRAQVMLDGKLSTLPEESGDRALPGAPHARASMFADESADPARAAPKGVASAQEVDSQRAWTDLVRDNPTATVLVLHTGADLESRMRYVNAQLVIKRCENPTVPVKCANSSDAKKVLRSITTTLLMLLTYNTRTTL